ncbi:YfiR family protein [Methyloglobulus sp.]|uniref:YfiR family protein n=1 Tax=Methyloglobulus sp. TaxID=2518622 RepID=UPI0032B82EAC
MNAIILLVGIVFNQRSAAAPSSEIQTLSVAYLYNFMKLSEWPTETKTNELTLCITQEGDLAKELDSLAGKEAQNHTLIIKRLVQGDDANECQLLFLPSEEKPLRIQAWINTLKDVPVLTVSDLEGFLDQGGMIALVNDGVRLQFEVDLERVEHTGIKLSSKMLQIAREVRGE